MVQGRLVVWFWRPAVCTLFFATASGFIADVRQATAQIPSNGVFYACVRLDKDEDQGRLVRLVAADEACKPKETRVHWNAAANLPGPPGPQGPTGATGARGATGPTGPSGATGATGAQGVSVATEPVAAGSPECGGTGGLKLTLLDAGGNPVGDPQLVCNGGIGQEGPQGPVGPTGPAGPAGSAVGFRQVFIGPTVVPSGAQPFNTIGQISVTVPSAGSAWLIWTGQCSSLTGGPYRIEIASTANAAVPNTTAAATVSASGPVTVSRSFALASAGTFTLFVNAERTTATGTAACFGPFTVLFTPGSQLPG